VKIRNLILSAYDVFKNNHNKLKRKRFCRYLGFLKNYLEMYPIGQVRSELLLHFFVTLVLLPFYFKLEKIRNK